MTANAQLNALVSQISLNARQGALETARTILTEENTDHLIEIIVPIVKNKLPVFLRWIPLGAVLDRLLPDVVLGLVEDLLA